MSVLAIVWGDVMCKQPFNLQGKEEVIASSAVANSDDTYCEMWQHYAGNALDV